MRVCLSLSMYVERKRGKKEGIMGKQVCISIKYNVSVCLYVCMCICICICVYVYTCIFVCMYVGR